MKQKSIDVVSRNMLNTFKKLGKHLAPNRRYLQTRIMKLEKHRANSMPYFNIPRTEKYGITMC